MGASEAQRSILSTVVIFRQIALVRSWVLLKTSAALHLFRRSEGTVAGQKRSSEQFARNRPGTARRDGSPDAAADPSRLDAELLLAVVAEDRGAFEALVDRHCQASWSLAVGMCVPGMARNVVAEVFGQMWRHPERALGSPETARDYVILRTHRAAVAALRGPGPLRAAALADRCSGGRPDASVESRRLARALHRDVVHRLEALPPIERDIIVLAYMGGYTGPELAQLFDRAPSEVALSIRHGLAALRVDATSSVEALVAESAHPGRADEQVVVAGRADRIAVICSGELDLASRAELEERLQMATATAAKTVVVDLENVSFIDAGTIGVFVATRTTLRSAGGDLTLRSPSAFARRVLAIVDLDDLIEVPASSNASLGTTERLELVVGEIRAHSRAEVTIDQAIGVIAGRFGLTIASSTSALGHFAQRCDEPVGNVAQDLIDGTRTIDEVRASVPDGLVASATPGATVQEVS